MFLKGPVASSFSAGASRTDRRRPRSEPDEAGENILTPIGFLFLCSSLLWWPVVGSGVGFGVGCGGGLICGGRWWVARWVWGGFRSGWGGVGGCGVGFGVGVGAGWVGWGWVGGVGVAGWVWGGFRGGSGGGFGWLAGSGGAGV
uniref:Uncharacterized protein n=1 Tax=Fagus sylvatica TaxID=28930 RepID=A0A2N9HE63_FAGSY